MVKKFLYCYKNFSSQMTQVTPSNNARYEFLYIVCENSWLLCDCYIKLLRLIENMHIDVRLQADNNIYVYSKVDIESFSVKIKYLALCIEFVKRNQLTDNESQKLASFIHDIINECNKLKDSVFIIKNQIGRELKKAEYEIRRKEESSSSYLFSGILGNTKSYGGVVSGTASCGEFYSISTNNIQTSDDDVNELLDIEFPEWAFK